MKRLFFIIATALLTVSATDGNKIQDKFLGCTLGKSTRPKVEKAMLKNKFEQVKNDSSRTVYYTGKFTFAGLEFNNIAVQYTNDTLDYFAFGNEFGLKNQESSRALQNNLSQKYNDLDVADSTLFAIIERNGFDGERVKTWSRKGNGKIVAVFSTYDYTKCVFAIEPSYSIHYDSAMMHMNNLKTYLASYDSVNIVKGVGGVNFGDDMATARPILQRKSERVMTDGDQLVGIQTTIGGVTYKYAYFTFFKGLGLSKVVMAKEYGAYERRAAELQFEAIVKQYKARYTNLVVNKDEKDNKVYSCGGYVDDYNYPPIFIMFGKQIDSETRNVKYLVIVSYFAHKEAPIDNNEI